MSSKIRAEVEDFLKTNGLVQLGKSSSYNWISDPARVFFSLARYKFVSRMFTGFEEVLEIGCADGFGSYLVSKSVSKLTCIDIDQSLIESARITTGSYADNIFFDHGDIEDSSFLEKRKFNGIFLLDVLEHIPRESEKDFLRAILQRLDEAGSVIIGMPSLESQQYASKFSKVGHINCKTQSDFKNLCCEFFHNCYMFGANDEIVNTGFPPMQHYRMALCSSLKI